MQETIRIETHEKVLHLLKVFCQIAKAKIFDELQGNKIPDIVITLKEQKGSYAYCTYYEAFENADGTIKYIEISYNINSLAREPKSILITMLHEMIHAYHYANKIKDCGQSQYHNNKFKATCELIGLEVEKIKRFGWSTTGNAIANSKAEEIINMFIEANKERLDKFKELLAINISKTPSAKNKNLHVYECPICHQKARAKANAFLLCGYCISEGDVYNINEYKLIDTSEEKEN